MSDIYNPYAFSVLGNPAPLVAPPALRVVSGQATPEQIAMARDAFTRFCSGVRLSHVPNPAEVGRLPDGSTYRITDVAGNRVMLLDAVNTGGTGRRSGIGISLTMLDGSLVPGHIHADGVSPQPYILTPEVTRSGRRSTGKWGVRKVNGYSGGKAVWSDETGRRSIVGVEGRISDARLINHRSVDRKVGTNNRAYWSGDYDVGYRSFTDGEKTVGVARSETELIPFFRRNERGELWIMQVGVEFSPYVLHLYGEKYTGAENITPIGELLGSLDIPAGLAIIWQSASIRGDGRKMRITANDHTTAALSADIEIDILDDGLSISSTVRVGGHTEQTETLVGDYNYKYEVSELTSKATRELDRTVTAGLATASLGFGYDARGDESSGEWTSAWDQDEHEYLEEEIVSHRIREPDPYGPGYVYRHDYDKHTRVAHSTLINRGWKLRLRDGTTIETPPGVVQSGASQYTEYTKYTDDTGTSKSIKKDGFFSSDRAENHVAVVFLDTLTGLLITRSFIRVLTSYTTIDGYWMTGMPPPIENWPVATTDTRRRNIRAVCKGNVILDETVDVADPEMWGRVDFVASSATDPLTGAVCVNILEIDPINPRSPPTRSWVILADDAGARHLHEVMNLPSGTSVRVKKDYALLSVV